MEYTDHLYCDTFPYVTPEELIACCDEATGLSPDSATILDAVEDASTVLYYLTGKQFAGTCTATVRPPCLKSGCMCGCSARQINLGFWPVTELISVLYQGVLYEGGDLTDTFHVNDFHYLARNDGQPFLSGNQWALALGDHDNATDGYVFEVTLQHGIKVPRMLTRATRALACEFVTACSTGECKLPAKVTSVVRSGISMDIASVTDLLKDGRTGVYAVDLAIQVFNPSKLQSPSFIWHPIWTPRGHRSNTGTSPGS